LNQKVDFSVGEIAGEQNVGVDVELVVEFLGVEVDGVVPF